MGQGSSDYCGCVLSSATPCSLWRGQVVVSHFPGKALAWRPFLLCGLPQLLVPSRLETAWPTSFRRQGIKFQVGWDWLGVGLGREVEDGIEGSLPGRAQLLHRAGHVLGFLGLGLLLRETGWGTSCHWSTVGKSCTEEAGECTGLRGLTRWCCQGRAKGTA